MMGGEDNVVVMVGNYDLSTVDLYEGLSRARNQLYVVTGSR